MISEWEKWRNRNEYKIELERKKFKKKKKNPGSATLGHTCHWILKMVVEGVWKKKTSEKFPNLTKTTNPQIQEAQWTPSKINVKKTTLRDTIIKLLKSSNKEEMLKKDSFSSPISLLSIPHPVVSTHRNIPWFLKPRIHSVTYKKCIYI